MRKARIKSETGLYHVCIRGVNRQDIFFDDYDKRQFLNYLKKYSKKYKVLIHSYSLLNNHVHLEIEDKNDCLSIFMQCLCSIYARYFNFKYDRVGHLFQERFASQIIETNEQFLTVLRYILQNSYKAGISTSFDYKWSSYSAYRKHNPLVITVTALGNFADSSQLYRFLNTKNYDECIDISLTRAAREKFYIEKIKRLLKSKTPYFEAGISKEKLLQKLKILKNNSIPVSVISRITGLSRYIVALA